VSRSYSYVYQRPWHYIWYSLVAIAYGSVLVFFVGLMGSLMVYLAKWGVSETWLIQTSKYDRRPVFLFVYAPTSFGWRNLLLSDATVHGQKLVDNGEIDQNAYSDYLDREKRPDGTPAPSDWPNKDKEVLTTYNKIGAFLVAIWLGLVFLLMIGFGYSYFWSASTIIYLLMRRHVDAAEMDEVYLEEDEQEGAYGGAFTPPIPPSSPAVKPPSSVTMVESPTLRTPATSTAPVTPAGTSHHAAPTMPAPLGSIPAPEPTSIPEPPPSEPPRVPPTEPDRGVS
jgi:hypothetical protein